MINQNKITRRDRQSIQIPGQTIGHPGTGTADFIKAKIVSTPEFADPQTDTDAKKIYTIKLLDTSDITADVWKAGVWIEEGELVSLNEKIYAAKLRHLTHDSNKPPNTSYWEDFSGELDAAIIHYATDTAFDDLDLTETVPLFNIDDIVEVIYYKRPADSEKHWYINATVAHSVFVNPATGVRRYSITNQKDSDGKNRIIACFA